MKIFQNTIRFFYGCCLLLFVGATVSVDAKIVFCVDGDIFVMNDDGSGRRRLTHNTTARDLKPRWSRDGTQIAFIRYMDKEKWIGDRTRCRLSFARIGGVAHIITDLYNRFGDNFLTSYAGWMENDRAILFAMKRLDKPAPNYDLYRYAFDTRKLRRLTHESSNEKYPDWTEGALSVSPNGKLTTLWGEIKQPAYAD